MTVKARLEAESDREVAAAAAVNAMMNERTKARMKATTKWPESKPKGGEHDVEDRSACRREDEWAREG